MRLVTRPGHDGLLLNHGGHCVDDGLIRINAKCRFNPFANRCGELRTGCGHHGKRSVQSSEELRDHGFNAIEGAENSNHRCSHSGDDKHGNPRNQVGQAFGPPNPGIAPCKTNREFHVAALFFQRIVD